MCVCVSAMTTTIFTLEEQAGVDLAGGTSAECTLAPVDAHKHIPSELGWLAGAMAATASTANDR